ncbi:S-adenosyl-L-methionine-dependent methyltransferase [Ilyonectria sp. MPI-CAGE-AT-0026]|nr:S-adenosyl-L-methionine-dependent methyltransferase [Ilyonectria sp. MPI-CAGE-AT-0026]
MRPQPVPARLSFSLQGQRTIPGRTSILHLIQTLSPSTTMHFKVSLSNIFHSSEDGDDDNDSGLPVDILGRTFLLCKDIGNYLACLERLSSASEHQVAQRTKKLCPPSSADEPTVLGHRDTGHNDSTTTLASNTTGHSGSTTTLGVTTLCENEGDDDARSTCTGFVDCGLAVDVLGRRFLRCKDTDNYLSWEPIDDRYDASAIWSHETFRSLISASRTPSVSPLYYAPLKPHQHDSTGFKVLDLGAGDCSWAIDFLKENPDVTIYAVDQCDRFPPACPQNLIPEIDGIDRKWTYPSNEFDFIHCRQVPWLQYMNTVLQQCFRCIKPGGLIELSYFEPELENQTAWKKWSILCANIRSKTGRAFNPTEELAERMTAAGFESVRVESVFFYPKDHSRYEFMDVKGLITLPLSTVLHSSDAAINELAKEMEQELASILFKW